MGMNSVMWIPPIEGEQQISLPDHQKLQEDAALMADLKACAKQRDLYKGSRLHAGILKRGLFQTNVCVGTTLVNMYAKCGALAKAQQIVDEFSVQNVVSWNALLVGHAQHGHGEQAIHCFERMQHEGLSPDAVTFACILKACSSIRAGEKGKEIHAEIVRKGLLENDIVLGNGLVDLYVKCGSLGMAQQVFRELRVQNVVSWTAIMAGYCQHGYGEKALQCFERIQNESLCPDRVTLLCILQACGSIGKAEKGKEIHAVISADRFLREDIVLGNALVDMYAKCGTVIKAQKAFDELPNRNIFSWTALVTGYCQHGHGKEALKCFGQMQHEGLSPDAVTFACILQACGSIGAAQKGKEIHDEILRTGLLRKDSVLSTALVDMYTKCGELSKAQQVFDELPVQDVVSWNALITGYSQQGYGETALECYERMKCDGFSPNAVTFACVLKACGSAGKTEKGREIHVDIAREGSLGKVSVLGSALVDMYIKCGALAKAQEVFDRLYVQDIVSWTALIAGYCQHGYAKEALNLFEQMKHEGLSPDAVTFACILKACGSIGAAAKGEFYFEIMSARYGIMPTLEDHTCMVELFGHAGCFDKAMTVIDKMPSSDYLPVWFTLLSSCRKWGNMKLGRIAFEHLVRLDRKSVLAYTNMSNIYAAAGMHEDAGKTLAKAQQLFDEFLVRDVVTWNGLIAAYYEHGRCGEALDCFERMKREGVSPNAVTFLCVLKACARIEASERGTDIHDDIVRVGLLGKDSVLGTALVNMYAKCGALVKAKHLFDELLCHDVISWNALITGYCQHGYSEEAIHCFEQMECEGISHDAVTFSCILKACGSIGAAEKGEEIHTRVFRKGLLGKDIVLGNALVDMYAKCGALVKAEQILDKLPVRNVVSWNALITGYCQHEDEEKALKCFEQMKREGLSPDSVTFICMLKACGSVGAVDKGKEVHVEIAREGLLGKVSVLGSALVDMYAKCGELVNSQETFDKLPVQDIVSWTALIAGYCQHGYGEESLSCFERMQQAGLSPDAVTFTCILKACSSIGALEKGQMYIRSMSTSYGIIPVLEHHTCMVDLFGRTGNFDMAMAMIRRMPSAYYLPAWFALLSACLQLGNVKLARLAFEHAVRLDEKSAVAYVCMSNIYAAAALQGASKKFEALKMGCEASEKPEHQCTDASHFVQGHPQVVKYMAT